MDQSPPHRTPQPPAEERDLQEAIRRLEESRTFYRFEAQLRLMRFLLENAKPNGEPLTEVEIASGLYGRPPEYDPRTDSIVRVSVIRLRQRLQEYYADEGCEDQVRIKVPRGVYAAVVTRLQGNQTEPAPRPARSMRVFWPIVIAILLLAAGAAWFYAAQTGLRH